MIKIQRLSTSVKFLSPVQCCNTCPDNPLKVNDFLNFFLIFCIMPLLHQKRHTAGGLFQILNTLYSSQIISLNGGMHLILSPPVHPFLSQLILSPSWKFSCDNSQKKKCGAGLQIVLHQMHIPPKSMLLPISGTSLKHKGKRKSTHGQDIKKFT